MKQNEEIPKVQINKQIKGLDPRNPHCVLELFRFLLKEKGEEFGSLEEALNDSPWTIEELHRYAQCDQYFAEALEKVKQMYAFMTQNQNS